MFGELNSERARSCGLSDSTCRRRCKSVLQEQRARAEALTLSTDEDPFQRSLVDNRLERRIEGVALWLGADHVTHSVVRLSGKAGVKMRGECVVEGKGSNSLFSRFHARSEMEFPRKSLVRTHSAVQPLTISSQCCIYSTKLARRMDCDTRTLAATSQSSVPPASLSAHRNTHRSHCTAKVQHLRKSLSLAQINPKSRKYSRKPLTELNATSPRSPRLNPSVIHPAKPFRTQTSSNPPLRR